jgi:hypothetical protein
VAFAYDIYTITNINKVVLGGTLTHKRPGRPFSLLAPGAAAPIEMNW